VPEGVLDPSIVRLFGSHRPSAALDFLLEFEDLADADPPE
jgi:hypothetical protein